MSIAQNNIPSFQQEFQNKFKAGLNISYYENYWKSDEYLINNFPSLLEKIKLANQIGFTTVRLAVSFDLFLLKGTNEIQPQLLDQLVKVHQLLDSNKMILIMSYQYGRLSSNEEIIAESKRVAYLWAQMVGAFKGKETIFFGLYSEPTISNIEWNFAQLTMMNILRPLDLDRFWIIGSINYNSIDALKDLFINPNDKRIVYGFHFYEPYIFTHQRAPWDKKNTGLKNLPYPYSPSEIPDINDLDVPITNDMRYNYNFYSDIANKSFVLMRLNITQNWIKQNNLPIICTEAGSINTIPNRYRENYMVDLTSAMRTYRIPFVLWDLDQSFSFVDAQGKPMKSVVDWINSF